MSASQYSVSLQRIIDEFNMEVVYSPVDVSTISIQCAEVNRPGLELGGFFEFFDCQRIQIIGKSEIAFLEQFDIKTVKEKLDVYFGHKPPVIIITREQKVAQEILSAAAMHQVPVLRTAENTSTFMSSLIGMLNVELAPRITRHGVLVEVYGEGILIVGESGVGKSESAIELVKRGHRLIADDAVDIRRVSNKTLVGSSPKNIRHFLELRGVGIVNVLRLFGIGSVKVTEKIDLVIQLEQWEPTRIYDRLGIDNSYTDILGINVPFSTIPIKPGRNLAIIIEVAAMNNRQKKMGYNSAAELLKRLEEGEDTSGDAGADWSAF